MSPILGKAIFILDGKNTSKKDAAQNEEVIEKRGFSSSGSCGPAKNKLERTCLFVLLSNLTGRASQAVTLIFLNITLALFKSKISKIIGKTHPYKLRLRHIEKEIVLIEVSRGVCGVRQAQ